MSNFTEIRPVRGALLHEVRCTYGWTIVHDETWRRFSWLRNAPDVFWNVTCSHTSTVAGLALTKFASNRNSWTPFTLKGPKLYESQHNSAAELFPEQLKFFAHFHRILVGLRLNMTSALKSLRSFLQSLRLIIYQGLLPKLFITTASYT
jgi:hypothetical protein